jgi:serine/threonine-protein kinase SRK2
MDYVAGGNMADYILKTILLKFGSFDTRDGLVMEEDEARFFFTQVINAVDYCHQNKVAHRWVMLVVVTGSDGSWLVSAGCL